MHNGPYSILQQKPHGPALDCFGLKCLNQLFLNNNFTKSYRICYFRRDALIDTTFGGKIFRPIGFQKLQKIKFSICRVRSRVENLEKS